MPYYRRLGSLAEQVNDLESENETLKEHVSVLEDTVNDLKDQLRDAQSREAA